MSGDSYDTPIIPGTKYHVHDAHRPQPRVVAPGDAGGPPSDAIVLFNGKDLTGWVTANGEPAPWKVQDGVMHVVPGTCDIQTVAHFGDAQVHVEFASPEVVVGEDQKPGNSGVFLLGLYEVQVLDSYENRTYADGTVGAIYGQFPPLVNAARRPGEWSTYDIIWSSPRFDGEKLVRPAYITVTFNGVVLHDHTELQGPTQWRKTASYSPAHPSVGPLVLQEHGALVRFRNIWYRPMTGYDGVAL